MRAKRTRDPFEIRQSFGIVLATRKRTPKTGRAFWDLRYRDPANDKYTRKRIPDEGFAALEDECKRISGLLPRERQTVPNLKDGIAQAIRLSRSRDYVKRDLRRREKWFREFIRAKFPTVETWADLKPTMLEEYVRHCEKQGLAFDSIRLRLVPVRMAWRRMHGDYPDVVRPVPRLVLNRPPAKEIECLSFEDVPILLTWLRENAPDVYPIQALAGLCGCRQMEAASIRFEDVDFEGGTVRITDTGRHKPKTAASERTIPIPAVVLEALRATAIRQKIRIPSGELFLTAAGNPWNFNSLVSRMRAVLGRAATELKNTRLKMPPRKLRAAFATAASIAGVQDRLLKAYLGHAPGDMLGGHYRRITLEELRALCSTVQALYEGRFEQQKDNIGNRRTVND